MKMQVAQFYLPLKNVAKYSLQDLVNMRLEELEEEGAEVIDVQFTSVEHAYIIYQTKK